MKTEDVAAMLIDQATDAFAVTGLTPKEMAARIATLTDQLTSLQNGYDLAVSRLEQQPDGYPSWEEVLLFLHRLKKDIEPYAQKECASLLLMDLNELDDLILALAAAKKEAADDRARSV